MYSMRRFYWNGLTNRRFWQLRFAGFQYEGVFHRIPGRLLHERLDCRSGPPHAEGDGVLNIRIAGHVDLSDPGFEPCFEDQDVHVRRPIIVALLKAKQAAD
jgi:hypothetical protein